MSAPAGSVCSRVSRRFDLGAHFAAIDGHVWQWTADARAHLLRHLGAAAQDVGHVGRNATDVGDCTGLTDLLLSGAAWVTVHVSDDIATAMRPHCYSHGRRVAFPDRNATQALFSAFHQTLVDAGRTAAASALHRHLISRIAIAAAHIQAKGANACPLSACGVRRSAM